MRSGSDGAADEATPPRSWSERTLESLTLRQKVGQMMMPIMLGDFAPEGTAGHDRIDRLVGELGVGGLIVSVGTPADVAVKINDMQQHATLPLLVAADLETGAGFRLSGAVHLPTNIVLGGATVFPPAMAIGATGDPRWAREVGRITGLEARAVGIHVPFAPVLDVNNNPLNPVINTRSFGEDPEEVAEMGAAFVRGLQENGALATGKHFPGHGDTEEDSHLSLPVIRLSSERMDSVELLPFRRAIEAGMGAVMTAHIVVPAFTGDLTTPATLSAGVLTDVLRNRLGFDGLLFTDAMDMGAIERDYGRGEAAVRAVEAGADVVLMPPDAESAIEALVEAVRQGRIREERIDRSVRRLLEMKASMGLDEQRFVETDRIVDRVGLPAYDSIAQEIADRSITLLSNGRNLLPLLGTRSARVMSVTYRRRNDLLAGRWFDARMRRSYPRLTEIDVDRDTPGPVWEGLGEAARRSDLVIVSLYIQARSYAGRQVIPDEALAFVDELVERNIPHIVLSFGNPYLIADFEREPQAYLLAWGGAEVSQRAAAKALMGEIPIRGRTPTAIPPRWAIGDGLRIEAREEQVDDRP